jgi:hypothetical protein
LDGIVRVTMTVPTMVGYGTPVRLGAVFAKRGSVDQHFNIVPVIQIVIATSQFAVQQCPVEILDSVLEINY